jgi:hypothetical protein
MAPPVKKPKQAARNLTQEIDTITNQDALWGLTQLAQAVLQAWDQEGAS